ncbi:MAG: substrate-binding domain-containing protein [Acidimicrobiia bacterium]
MRKLFATVACSMLAWPLVSCGDDGSSSGTTAPEVTTAPAADAPVPTTAPATTEAATATAVTAAALDGTLTIMAPGPFKGVLEAAKTKFEAANPGVTIELNLGHVPTLLTQLEGGVVADVLITPDSGTMGQAGTKGLTTGKPTVFAKVPMALVVPAGNAAGVVDVTALAKADLRVAVCAAELPCGKLADQLASKAGIVISADTLETGGSPGVVTKASTGEIDVGLVFATDIAAGGDKVAKVAIPDTINVASDASVAVLKAADDADVAAAFLAYLTSEAGLSLVTGKGFLAP